MAFWFRIRRMMKIELSADLLSAGWKIAWNRVQSDGPYLIELPEISERVIAQNMHRPGTITDANSIRFGCGRTTCPLIKTEYQPLLYPTIKI